MKVERDFVEQPARMPKVVILCAQEDLRDVIAYWFGSLPVVTSVAADGYDASKSLQGISDGLLITDRILPPWPGLDTFMQLRADNPRLRIAIIEDGTPNARILARLTGATAVLHRPLKRQQVLGALDWPALVS